MPSPPVPYGTLEWGIFGIALVGLLDAVGDLLHLGDQRVRTLFFFFEPGNFVAGLVALCFALFIFGDEFAALFVENPESVEVEGDIALPGHFGEEIQVLAEKVQIMHGVGRIA